jgi:RND superfamily putative drug exporter
VLDRLAGLVARHPGATVLTWLAAVATALAFAVAGIGGAGLFERLQSGPLRVPGAESLEAYDRLEAGSRTGPRVTLLVSGVDLRDPATATALAGALRPVEAELAATEDVAAVVHPFRAPLGTDPAALALVSRSGDGFLLAVDLTTDADGADEAVVVDRLAGVPDELRVAAPAAEGIVSSSSLITKAVTDQVSEDLKTGELVALPVSLLVMVVVFGGFLVAGLPLAGALASVAGGLGVLLGFTFVMDVDSSVVNVVTVLGLGLSIDYGLLIVSRFREELRDGVAAAPPERRDRRRRHDPVIRAALARTMTTAGRTVAFSAVTVAISIGGLLVMRPEILRSIGAAGVAVVVLAVLTAATLVPALLVLLGRRILDTPLLARVPGLRGVLHRFGQVAPHDGVFSRLAARVQRRPWLVLAGSVAVLAVLASPVLSLQLRNTTTELVPVTSDQRTFLEKQDADYPVVATPDVLVVAGASAAEVDRWAAAEVAGLPDVASVSPARSVGEVTVLGVQPETDDPGGPVASDVVRAVRGLDPAFPTWVTGQAAGQIDFVDALLEGLPWAAGIVVTATLVLLFLMTGSVLVPLKALVINLVSLTASLGVTAWIFQQGNLEDVLGFTSVGGLESYVVAVVLAFGFGLAMDYEVFLLSRIQELYEGGMTNDEAVRYGLQRSGRVITSAALIIVVVFLGFVAGELLVIKEVGVALAVTVIVDATLVRMLLVPATMTLLADRNWWAPPFLRRMHDRYGLREGRSTPTPARRSHRGAPA